MTTPRQQSCPKRLEDFQSEKGSRVAVNSGKTFFPDHMNHEAIQNAVRQAYRYSKKVTTQNGRVLLIGTDPKSGLQIEMWLNKTDKRIETSYPIF